MKNSIYFGAIMAALIVVSCADESDNLYQQGLEQTTKHTTTRDLSDAIQIAQNATNMFASTRGGSDNSRTVDLNNIEYVTNRTTRSNGSQDTLLYIINYENEQGFCLVSASNNTEGVLAVTDQGEYNAEFAASDENGGFKNFMALAEQYVMTANTESSTPDMDQLYEFNRINDTISNITVLPKVAVRWGQSGVEGACAPNGIAGCVNTAMAQIMSYFEHPTSINITYTENISSLALDWTEIKKHVEHHYFGACTASTTTHQTLGHFIREIGYLNHSIYDNGVTAATMEDAMSTFQQLGYRISNVNDYNGGVFVNNLRFNQLIFMGGFSSDDNPIGHAWIVDGAYQYIVHSTEWKRVHGEIEWTLHRDYGNITTEYMHINWGWDGNCNGYFAANVFDTSRGRYDLTEYPYNNVANGNYNKDLVYFTITRLLPL